MGARSQPAIEWKANGEQDAYQSDPKFFVFTILTVGMALISACTTGQATVSGITGPLVLRNGSVFTASSDEPIANASIVIEDGIITAVGPAAEIEFPAGATVIDVEGRTVLPGLIDTSVYVLEHIRIKDGKSTPLT